MQTHSERITFSFGKNWRDYVDTINENSIQQATNDIEEWLRDHPVSGKTVLDIGSGSGIHSFCFFMMGAREIVSLDVDPYSVESTRLLWQRAGSPANWKVIGGSILDAEFVGSLGQHEIVYSWGVLHHTGAMWQAIDNACSLVQPGGRLWIALYVKGPTYPKHLALKQSYNRASWLGKKVMVWKYVLEHCMIPRWKAGINPFAWNTTGERGMNVYHDIVDWLGGLPYEVASTDEVVGFCKDRGFALERVLEAGEQSNNIYLFSRTA